MAKNTKGGLGRGLNSLLGGYEAALDPAPAPRVQETLNPAKTSPEEKKEAIPKKEAEPRPAEREVIREEDLPQEERVVLNNEKNAPQRPLRPAPVRAMDSLGSKTVVKDVIAKKELIEENDGVTIKGVVEREARPTEQISNGAVPEGIDSAVSTHSEETVRVPAVSEASAQDRELKDSAAMPVSVQAAPAKRVSAPSSVMDAYAIGVAQREAHGVSAEAGVAKKDASDEAIRATDEVPIELIKPNPDQPRMHFNKDELEELSSSIEKDGLLQPILVRAVGDEYEIIAGERRWQACQLAGLTKVPIRIKEADDMKVLELALIENLQRSDLNPIEEAYGYKRMMERGNRTQSEVASAVSKGRSTIANALRLLDLPEDAQQLLYEEKITAGHARAILAIPDDLGRQKLTDKLAAEKISVREAEAIARLFASRAKRAENPVKKAPAPKIFKTAARSLGDTFGTKVRIRSANGKNKIEIEFKDEEDLQRLFDLMNNHHDEVVDAPQIVESEHTEVESDNALNENRD